MSKLECPECKVTVESGARFTYADPVVNYRPISMRSDGELVVDYETTNEDDSSREPAILCDKCQHVFPVPSDFFEHADWG